MYKYCLEHELLPDNHLDIEANHRESILIHDTLKAEDIEEYYQKFTQIRTDSYLKKYGMHLTEEGKEEVRRRYDATARSG